MARSYQGNAAKDIDIVNVLPLVDICVSKSLGSQDAVVDDKAVNLAKRGHGEFRKPGGHLLCCQPPCLREQAFCPNLRVNNVSCDELDLIRV